ncbi:2TM domain-containing protein [Flavimarina sp. Hel_I_48]|uniref:2TM domain-containing protein n=1 Tax=Flavimarina sp. Hel_I_48 TaxID=1392488 RepID=UPI0004DEDBA6|nr:2TM domain-containing protein [Flavimarina sp. Hel_I_48]
MFSKKQESTKIDHQQRELIEYAQLRVKKKKNLFRHFVIFLAGAILLIILNLILDFGKDFRPFNVDWFVWAILIWFFIFLVHFLNVFLINVFMDKKWEHEQIDKLVAQQKARIAELKDRVEKENPPPEQRKSPFISPNRPLNQ